MHLVIADRVWLRQAQAGDLAERFGQMVLIDGDEALKVVPTHGGEGVTLL